MYKTFLTSGLTVLIIISISLFLTDCKKDDDPSTPKAPVITSFSPVSGTPGTTVVITGTGFSKTASENVVTFNDVIATVSSSTATSITVVVPETATTGKISVTNAALTATSATDFEVLVDIPRTGLVAFYPFKGNANDVSGNNLNGTVTEAALTADRFGKTNQAYSFDGVNDFITMGNPALLQINDHITIAGWFNIDAFKTSGNQYMAMIVKIYFDPNAGGNPARGYELYQDATPTPTPYFGAASFNATGSAFTFSNAVSSNVPLDTWIFVALVMDGTSWKFYQDGELKDSGTTTDNALADGTLGDFVIGSYGGGFFFDGYIDDVVVYNRGLSVDEIIQLKNQTITKY